MKRDTTRINDLIGRASLVLPPLTAVQIAEMMLSGELTADAAEELIETAEDMRKVVAV